MERRGYLVSRALYALEANEFTRTPRTGNLVSENTTSETVSKRSEPLRTEAQKQAKQVEKAPFSLLEANCKGVSVPAQTLFGQFL
jgi:hypothetical protein